MDNQHPLFIIYRRDWLFESTGYSKVYLSRIATGKVPLTRYFIGRVCSKLKRPEAELFLPEPIHSKSSQSGGINE